MKTALILATTSLLLTAFAPLASAEAIPHPCDDDGAVRNLPRGDETCQDVDYVANHWVTQTAMGAVGRTVDIAVCLSGADPYNWAPSDYVDCAGLRVD